METGSTSDHPDALAEELDFSSHNSRQWQEMRLSRLEERLAMVRPGGRAAWDKGLDCWNPLPYPGYAFQAMVREEVSGSALQDDLVQIQNQLLGAIHTPGVLFPLPSDSFHQTVANLFSQQRLFQRLPTEEARAAFPSLLKETLGPGHPEPVPPPSMHLIGLGIFRTAIGMLGIVDRREDYERVLAFRRRIYEARSTNDLGLVRTRPWIAHVTLAYFEAKPTPEDGERLLEGVELINRALHDEPLSFSMPVARLHHYDHLAAFHTREDYPWARL